MQAAKNTKITIPHLKEMKQEGQKIAMLTCYDACFSTLMNQSGVDVLLVGDSLGMVLAGYSTTIPVTIDQMVYHTQCVAAGNSNALIMADMPFGSYQENPQQAYRNATKLIAAGAHMVKLEGDQWLSNTIEFLSEREIPVCAHLGLKPQSVNALGGYKLQAKTTQEAEKLTSTALMLEKAGAKLILFELIPSKLAETLTKTLQTPTIGIGAGPHCDGQVLVMHDMLNIYTGKKPKFVKNFMDNQANIGNALESYVTAVKNNSFPGQEHSF